MTHKNTKKQQADLLNQAVKNKPTDAKRSLWDRLFVKAFEGLVYPQIWEDPESDMLALNLNEKSRIVCIASGGCNIMTYLTQKPEKIDGVDLNRHHIALNRLKHACAKNFPNHDMFFKMFGHANLIENIKNYDEYIAPHLHIDTRAYWSGRKVTGVRRITAFKQGFYRFGLLGTLIGFVHKLSNAYGKSPRKAFLRILESNTQEQRQEIFDREIGCMFDKRLVKWIGKMPASLYGLGIPPAQYEALRRSGDGDVIKTLRDRTEKLAIGFDPKENYFAWQAFLRKYDTVSRRAIPTYLKPDSFSILKEHIGKVDVHHINMIDFLASLPDQDRNAFCFLDAQDWMSDEVLTRLWTEVTRVAQPDARVVFRTADFTSPLETALPQEILSQWTYDEELSKQVTDADRSAIYGAAHVYIRKG